LKLTPINPESLGEAKGYSNGILAPAGARLLFVAGQIGWDKEHRFPQASDPAEKFLLQIDRALKNVLEVVRAAGGSGESLARVTIYVTDKKLYCAKVREIGKVWRENVGRWYPAMTLAEVADLLEDEALVEVEATALVPSGGPA
jgi:enamine deaminase RidA (YjgF/YER057c/UK114 family)